ncbi:MAG: hypothetical protein NC827_05950 [Candidatus Omnitrophica bacterium]|nr:hypothetical protein [Candidatus Omnitrophota bacterium]
MVNIKILGENRILKLLRAPRYKKPYTISLHPPWSKYREWKLGLRPKQLEVIKDFTKYAHATAKMNLADRMEVIKRKMTGKSYGGVKIPIYPKKTRKELEEFIAGLP